MSDYGNPNWWDASHDFAWDHVKRAMRHHWEQASQQLHSNDLTAFDRIKGEEIALSCHRLFFDELEPAFRFGFGARIEFGEEHQAWDDNLEILLAREWRRLDPTREQTWEQDREAIRYGWEFEEIEIGRNVEAKHESSFQCRVAQPSFN